MADEFTPSQLSTFLDRFRALLHAGDAAAPEELAEAISFYGSLSAAANRRLQGCKEAVDGGHLSFAIELAEEEPPLLARCAALEIPEREAVHAIASQRGLPLPALVKLSATEALQSAYDRHARSAAEMKNVQKLAIGRGPLPTRLAIMREMLAADPDRANLDKDIRDCERAWFLEAAATAVRLASAGRSDLVEEIIQDLKGGGYYQTPPASLATNLFRIFSGVRATELAEVARDIRNRFAQDDMPGIAAARERWKTLAASVGAGEGAEIKYDVRDAFLALDAWERREEAARELKLALASSSDPQRLDVAYTQAVKLDAVDAASNAAYFAAKKSIRNRAFARTAMAVGATAVAVLVFGGVLWTAIDAIHYRSSVATATERLRILVDQKRYREAVDFSETISPRVAATAEVAMTVKEAERGLAFDEALRRLTDCPADEDATPIIEAARMASVSDAERDAVDKEEALWRTRQAEFAKAVGLQIAALNQRLENAGEGNAEELRREWAALDEAVRKARLKDVDLVDSDRRIAVLEKGVKFRKAMASLNERLADASPSDELLKEIARTLHDDIAPLHADESIAETCRMALTSSDAWSTAFGLERSLREDPTSAVASKREWRGEPPYDLLRAVEIDQELVEEVRDARLFVGWVAQDRDGGALLRLFPGGPRRLPDASLYVVVQGEWVSLGASSGGTAKLNGLADVYFGWPVFSVRQFRDR